MSTGNEAGGTEKEEAVLSGEDSDYDDGVVGALIQGAGEGSPGCGQGRSRCGRGRGLLECIEHMATAQLTVIVPSHADATRRRRRRHRQATTQTMTTTSLARSSTASEKAGGGGDQDGNNMGEDMDGGRYTRIEATSAEPEMPGCNCQYFSITIDITMMICTHRDRYSI